MVIGIETPYLFNQFGGNLNGSYFVYAHRVNSAVTAWLLRNSLENEMISVTCMSEIDIQLYMCTVHMGNDYYCILIL